MKVRRCLCVLLFAALASACSKKGDADTAAAAKPVAAAAAATARTVSWSGCSAWVDAGVCELHHGDVSVRAFVPEATAKDVISLELDGRAIDATPVQVDAGRRLDVKLPHADGVLRVMVGGVEAARLKLAKQVRPEALAAASALKKKRKTAEALKALGDPALLPPAWRDRGASLKARLLRKKGQNEAVVPLLHASSVAHAKNKRWSDALSDGFVSLFIDTTATGDLGNARRTLERLRPIVHRWPEGAVRLAYYEGLLRRDSGDRRGALRLLTRAADGAEQLGIASVRSAAHWARGFLLAAQDRKAFDVWLQSELEQTPAKDYPCDHEQLLSARAWNVLMWRESNDGAAPPWAPEPRALLSRGLALAKGKCNKPQRVLSNHSDLALEAVQRGDVTAARASLDDAEALTVTPDLYTAVWLDDVRARVLLATNDTKGARGQYARLEARAAALGSPAIAWRAATGAGRAAEAAGDATAAIDAFRRAEGALDRELRGLPVTSDSSALLAGRHRSARALANLLLQVDRVDDAFDVLRRARARSLITRQRADRLEHLPATAKTTWSESIARYLKLRSALDRSAADDWRLSAEQLTAVKRQRAESLSELQRLMERAYAAIGVPAVVRQPQPAAKGEAVVGVFSSGRQWRVFVQTTDHTRSHVTAATSSALQGSLEAADALSQKAMGRVRLILGGAISEVDVHALTWRGKPLVASVPIVYALDIRTSSAPAGAPGAALVVADPDGDLPLARKEGQRVVSAFGTKGRLLQGEAATFDALVDGLGAAQLLHFAGHGRFDGFDSGLTLARGQRLSVGDILALPVVPSRVVLSGCETARTASSNPIATIGLAQAFVASGASQVVATTRPVADREARRFSELLYEAAPASRWDLPSAVAAAQLALKRADPKADWAAYRVLEN